MISRSPANQGSGDTIILNNRQIPSWHEYPVKTWQHCIPIHPVQTLARRYQSHTVDLVRPPLPTKKPMQSRIVPIGQRLAHFDHVARKIYRVNFLDTIYQISRNIANATTNIQHMPRFSANKPRQNIENSEG